MLTYGLLTGGVFVALCAVFVVADKLAAWWERRERDRWRTQWK